MHDLTAFQRDILWFVNDIGDPKGLSIKRRLDRYYEQDVHHGRLYPNLDELVEMGLLEKGTKDRRTNEYTLTPRARRELESRLNFLDENGEGTVRAEMEPKAAEVGGD